MSTRRALHFVFKVGNRKETTNFYRNVLGMQFLRHEEFEKGCEASCNGPYNGRWSKSMVGYGPEESHFVIELTYNYEIGSYTMGNDFLGITVESDDILQRVKDSDWPKETQGAAVTVQSPDGHLFLVKSTPGHKEQKDPVSMVSLAVSNLARSIEYWQKQCGMTLYAQDVKSAILGYSEIQCHLQLVAIAEAVDHAKAYGRIAFGCPKDELAGIEHRMREAGHTILTPLISLDTPGKATVEVVIPADPDGHEICFVGDEAFRELSAVDPEADRLLDEAIEKDKSNEWFAKKGRAKATE